LRSHARRLAEGRREPPKLYSKHDWEAHKRSAHRELAERDQESAKPGARALKESIFLGSYDYEFFEPEDEGSNGNDYVPNTFTVGNITGSEDVFDGEVSLAVHSEST
jgi:hypothetical protein